MKNIVNKELIPKRQTIKSSGYDFCANEDMECPADVWTSFDTGVCFDGTERPQLNFIHNVYSEIKMSKLKFKIGERKHTIVPENWFMMCVPRSGHGVKYKVRFSTTIGIIDQDYRDTIKVEIKPEKSFTIKKGDRYAQGIFIPTLILDDEIVPTEERKGGFGSTGN